MRRDHVKIYYFSLVQLKLVHDIAGSGLHELPPHVPPRNAHAAVPVAAAASGIELVLACAARRYPITPLCAPAAEEHHGNAPLMHGGGPPLPSRLPAAPLTMYMGAPGEEYEELAEEVGWPR